MLCQGWASREQLQGSLGPPLFNWSAKRHCRQRSHYWPITGCHPGEFVDSRLCMISGMDRIVTPYWYTFCVVLAGSWKKQNKTKQNKTNKQTNKKKPAHLFLMHCSAQQEGSPAVDGEPTITLRIGFKSGSIGLVWVLYLVQDFSVIQERRTVCATSKSV